MRTVSLNIQNKGAWKINISQIPGGAWEVEYGETSGPLIPSPKAFSSIQEMKVYVAECAARILREKL